MPSAPELAPMPDLPPAAPTPPGEGAAAPPAAAVLAATKAAIEELAADPAVAERIASAAVIVRLTVVGDDDPGLTLLFDREPVEVLDGGDGGRAEVGLHLPAAELHRFWCGASHPALAILRGTAGYEGPVRKALRVFPILLKGRDAYLRALP